jgi:hypothetical protein
MMLKKESAVGKIGNNFASVRKVCPECGGELIPFVEGREACERAKAVRYFGPPIETRTITYDVPEYSCGGPGPHEDPYNLYEFADGWAVADVRSVIDELLFARGESGAKSPIMTSIEELQEVLPKILEEFKADYRRWILIIEVPSSAPRYVQVLVHEDGGLFAECVSDEFLGEEDQLDERQRETLPLLGWGWPGPPSTPNWHFHDELLNTGTAVSGLLLRTLSRVFSCTPETQLEVRVFSRDPIHDPHR